MNRSLKVIIVEDEALNLTLLKMLLKELKVEICAVAATCEEALKAAELHCPDLILLDIRLPGKNDGIQTAHLIREKCAAKIIFITGYDTEDIQRQTAPLNPIACLQKPVILEDLKLLLEKNFPVS